MELQCCSLIIHFVLGFIKILIQVIKLLRSPQCVILVEIHCFEVSWVIQRKNIFSMNHMPPFKDFKFKSLSCLIVIPESNSHFYPSIFSLTSVWKASSHTNSLSASQSQKDQVWNAILIALWKMLLLRMMLVYELWHRMELED